MELGAAKESLASLKFIQLKKACNMLRGKGQVRTQDPEDTRRGALTTAPLALIGGAGGAKGCKLFTKFA
jgi:hypothetical protein